MKLECLPIENMRLDNITGRSLYGHRIHPVTGRLSMHYGIDRSCPVGTPILATIDGVAVVSKLQHGGGGLGEYVVINKSDYYVVCAHLSKRIVKAGQAVKVGQVIGYSGNTGSSTGPHLHFGVCRNYNKASANRSDWVDPMPLLKEVNLEKETEEEEMVKRYNKVSELSKGLRPEAKVLIDCGALAGDGNGNLDVTEDMIRVLIISKRYADSLKKM